MTSRITGAANLEDEALSLGRSIHRDLSCISEDDRKVALLAVVVLEAWAKYRNGHTWDDESFNQAKREIRQRFDLPASM